MLFYHGTSLENANAICKEGWKIQNIRPAQVPTLLTGTYFTNDKNQAMRYTKSMKNGVVIAVRFKNNKLKKIQNLKDIRYLEPEDVKQYAGLIIPSTVAFPDEVKPEEYIVFCPNENVEILFIEVVS